MQSLEELTYSDLTGTCPGIVPNIIVYRVRLELSQTRTSVVPGTWGQLKALYHP